ncbi:BAG family molecular chaperone regulator 5, mitochondrial [Cornus florida]|uniref:BAG family molecular chaperone regulator 5, mitochondrial n=1 Tax=Cornus florida TaxID=4283 RepID=UPI00289B7FD8|nr:BAG family molecular chaperone regulator 5, mitochondrial [Cornus florida]
MKMYSSRKIRFFSTSSSTVTYTFQNDHSAPQTKTNKTTEIPIIDSSTESPAIPITVHLSTSQSQSSASAAAAVKIQSAYRSYIVRALVKKISAVNSEANRLERLLQRQETVDAIRGDDRERMRMNEALMGLLLRLDSVPGVDQTVRELRRHVSHRIVGLQEILDAVSDAKVEDWDGLMRNWDDVVAEIENDVCRERGGHEMERFCAENLGFRCLQRFLREL